MQWLNFSCHWESFIQREGDIWTDQYGIMSMELAVCNMMLLEFFKILIFYMFQDVGMKIFKFLTIFWIMTMLSYSGRYISAINPLLLKKESEYFQFSNLKPLWSCLILLQSGDFFDQLLRWMPFYTLVISLVSLIYLSMPLWLYVWLLCRGRAGHVVIQRH